MVGWRYNLTTQEFEIAPFTLAYVTNVGGASVSVINLATNTVTTTIGVGDGPQGVAVNPAGTLAYVANFFGDSVSVINLG